MKQKERCVEMRAEGRKGMLSYVEGSSAIISDDGAAGVVKARVFDRAADDRLDDNGGKRKGRHKES